MSENNNSNESWSPYAKAYDPIKIGSIDGTDIEPHDKAIVRANNSEYWSNKHAKGHPERTIFVARLSPKTTKDTIKEVFSKYGRLQRFRLVKDIVTGAPKGYAFIEYQTERAAEEAYRKANKVIVDGQAIFVDFECERLLKGWKPRRLGGGFGGNKESGQLRFGGRDRPFRKPIQLEIEEKKQIEQNRRERSSRRSNERTYRDNRERSKENSRRRSPREEHRRRYSRRSPEERELSSDRSKSNYKSYNSEKNSDENTRHKFDASRY